MHSARLDVSEREPLWKEENVFNVVPTSFIIQQEKNHYFCFRKTCFLQWFIVREPIQEEVYRVRVEVSAVKFFQMSKVSFQTVPQASVPTSVTMEQSQALMFIVSSTIYAAEAGTMTRGKKQNTPCSRLTMTREKQRKTTVAQQLRTSRSLFNFHVFGTLARVSRFCIPPPPLSPTLL